MSIAARKVEIGKSEIETEVQVQKGDIALCFLIQRSNRSMRVIDFRSGPQAKKAEIVQEVAHEQGIERVFTVVEREESATWTRMGFEREGVIPGFYKRSDGHLLGMKLEQRIPAESGTRIKLSAAAVESGAGDRGERAFQAAKKMAKAKAPEQLPRVKVATARPQDIDKALETAARQGRELTSFESFGRGTERQYSLCTARGGFSLLVGVELQACFDNAWIEMLVAPRGDKEVWLTVSGLEQVVADLTKQGLVSTFAVSPVESVELAAALLAAGFRRTGRLVDHLVVRGARSDAFLWSRKLTDPT